ncbi:sugar phosphate nucleotidyltransferase [Ferroplasma sp.]|uniref:sugar phosphate nucleotidyltransferase n=1 Tax=Ferroplasma sp. TaxID=2591003 RepID=UPI00307DE99F
MDALITAAGKGTRANLPEGMRKEMLPIYTIRNNKIVLRPIIECIVYNLSLSGVDKFFIILDINDKHTEDYLSTLNMRTEFIYQKKPEGYGKAVLLAKDYIKNDFILNAGDGIILDINKIGNMINLHRSTKKTILSVMSVPNPELYGVATIKNGKVIKVIEKPEYPESKYALAAFYIFNKEILDLIAGAELTPAINKHIINGNKVLPFKIRRSDWVSIGNSGTYYKIMERTYNYYSKVISS